MAITSFPNDAVCFVLSDIPGVGEFQGSGVIIGPHTILTAAHLLYDADTGAIADQVSVYPGYESNGFSAAPAGALPGNQSIHTIRVPDYGEQLSVEGSQRDFAVINTSTDLSAYGAFAMDPNFTSGDVVVNGYPANRYGRQAGTGGVLSQVGSLSAIDTSSLPLSQGYSGGPIWDVVARGGNAVPAVAGLVSTEDDGMKLTPRKVALIRYWAAMDRSLYDGGVDVARGLTPQFDGTLASPGSNSAPAAPAAQAATLAAAILSGGDATVPAFGGAADGSGRGGFGAHHHAFGAEHGASPFDGGHHDHHHRHGPFNF